MLGYVRIEKSEMLVKHYSLYQALYCGLCHSIKKNTTRFLQPFLSYDFVFLAALRLLVTKEKIEPERQKCLLHPFKKKMRIRDNEALCFAAKASLVLTTEKMLDDRLDADVPLMRRLVSSVAYFFLKAARNRLCRREKEWQELSRDIAAALSQEREMERDGADLDAMCNHFSALLSRLASFGTEGLPARYLSCIAGYLGRYIYTLDAFDDWERDEKSGSFNPLLNAYGKKKEAVSHFPEIDLVLSFYVGEMVRVMDLIEGDRDLYAVCENIIKIGLPHTAKKIFSTSTGEKQ